MRTSFLLVATVAAIALFANLATRADDKDKQQEGASDAHKMETKAATITVEISDFAYDPEIVEIHAGDTVKWVNKDDDAHTATRTANPAFDTGLLRKNESGTITFPSVSPRNGWEYFCGPHPSMRGRVVVRSAGVHLAQRGSKRNADSGSKEDGKAAPKSTATVRIRNFKYEPENVEITVGDTVKWINEDAAPHTATRNDEPSPFDTGFLSNTDEREITFNVPSDGVGFEYFCLPHPFMKGRVIVKLSGSHVAGLGHAKDHKPTE